MSPAKSCNLNGHRPSPLLIHKDSRTIRKPSQPPPPQLRQPVIIYTHSPKIIHTQPKDFMALVQRLTGRQTVDANLLSEKNTNENDCSSVLTDDNDLSNNSSSFLSADVPFFAPRSSLLRYNPVDMSPFSSPGLVNSLSPSFMEFLKGLPECESS